MGKKKIIISLVLLVALIIIGTFCYWYFGVQKEENKIRQVVLNSLEEKLEFCQIIKDNIDRGELWLICNGRPFYATYNNGEISYDLNGWDLLKNTEYWSELENCDFYDSEKVGNNYNLTFYCPKDFAAEKLTAKTYSFSAKTTKTNKLEEKNFLEIVSGDIKNIYPFLSKCEIKNFTPMPESDPPALFLTYTCQGEEWSVVTLGTITLLPPILMNPDLSYEQRAKTSFEKSFGWEINSINLNGNAVTISSSSNGNEFIITYRFLDTPLASYRINCEKPCLKFGKYFIFPPIEDTEKATFIKEKRSQTPISFIYRVGEKIINVGVINNNVVLFWQEPEGFK